MTMGMLEAPQKAIAPSIGFAPVNTEQEEFIDNYSRQAQGYGENANSPTQTLTSRIIQKGDTLSGIAGNNLAQLGLIVAENKLTSSKLKVGESLLYSDIGDYSGRAQRAYARVGNAVYAQDRAELAALQAEKARRAGGVVVFDFNDQSAGINRNNVIYGTNSAPVASNSAYGTIGPRQDYTAAIGAIYNSNLSVGEKLSMAWGNTKFYFQGSEQAQGTVQMVGGVLEVVGAGALSSTGGGAVIGVPLAFHGGDSIGTGFSRIFFDQHLETVTYNGVEAATGSPRVARFVDNAIPFAGGTAGIGQTVGNLPLVKLTRQTDELGLTVIDSSLIRTTQATVKQQGATIPKLVENMQRNGFLIESDRLIDVVRMSDGSLTSLDNTRILAASRADVLPRVRIFNDTDLLPNDIDYISRFVGRKGEIPQTFGDAVRNRINNQNKVFREHYPNGSPFIGTNF